MKTSHSLITELARMNRGFVHPVQCALCGRTPLSGNPPHHQWVFSIFEECDDHDEPNGKFLVLCNPDRQTSGCANGPTIENNPRLYIERYYVKGEVCPGAMPQCSSCHFRRGVRCCHPGRYKEGLLFSESPTLKDEGIEWTSKPKVLDVNGPTDWPLCQSRLGIVKLQKKAST